MNELEELKEQIKKLTERINKLESIKEPEKPKTLTVNDLVEGQWYWDTWYKKYSRFVRTNYYDDSHPLRFTFDNYEEIRISLKHVDAHIRPYECGLNKGN
jgi:hypothetical protein